MYRPPGRSVDKFNDQLKNLLQKLEHRNLILCGDFNINLLNTESHLGTEQFLQILNNYGAYPLITKPTRITLGSSTLIDNIFTNLIRTSKNGILINDISDHLPTFSVID